MIKHRLTNRSFRYTHTHTVSFWFGQRPKPTSIISCLENGKFIVIKNTFGDSPKTISLYSILLKFCLVCHCILWKFSVRDGHSHHHHYNVVLEKCEEKKTFVANFHRPNAHSSPASKTLFDNVQKGKKKLGTQKTHVNIIIN